MKNSLYPCLLLLFATACHSNSKPAKPENTDSATAQKAFLPIANYLQGEISFVDSTPLAILKYDIRDKKRDSAYIQQSEFNQLAQQFLRPELAPDSFQQNYTENSFVDETTKSLTFTYSAINKTTALQRADVLIVPTGTSNQVKSIYLQENYMTGDTQVVKKLYWEARKQFEITTTQQLPHQPLLVKELRVVWDQDNPQ